jgi:adenine-specific DNA-methyltransferase
VFIEGENLEVLRVLQKSYFGKIKMIYIDPPYNTGNDSFVYPDDYSERSDEFNMRTGITDENGFLNKQDLWQKNNKENGRFHSVWLSMMYPRLYLARNLLREDGVIFISIDDNEASNLKLICDEVFGEENFVANVIWQKKYAASNDVKGFAAMHDHIFVYQKSIDFSRNLLPRTSKQDDLYKYDSNDGKGLWRSDNLTVKTFSESYYYEIINPNTQKGYYPTKGRCWLTNKDTIQKWIDEGRVFFGQNGEGALQLKRYLQEVQQGTVPQTIWFHEECGHNDEARKEIKELFENPPFDTPKPSRLIKRILQLSTQPKENQFVIDFFAGSGTTAQAVMELNEEDGGNRQFICVQMPEVLEANSEAYKAGYKTIADITKARISKVIEKITTERESKLELETRQLLGFNAYKLAPSNFKIWRSDIQGKDAILEQLQVFQSSEKSDSPQENMLTELLLKTGLGLGVKYFQEQNFYKVGNFWICFEKFQPEMKEQILQGNVQKVIFLNSCFASDAELSNLQLELKENEINLVII